jgi:hypothetical protein
MASLYRFIKRNPFKITASVATLYLANKFTTYCASDHFEGQNVLQGVSQTLYWILREQLGLVQSTEIPFTPEEITREKVQACLHNSGTIKPGTKIKSIEVSRIGAGEGVISMVFMCNIIYEDGHNINNSQPTKVVVKLLPKGIKVRILLRITGQPSNEAGFYTSEMATETGLPIPKPYFVGYIPGRQNFCLMMEDMSHCIGGNGNELSGLSLKHAKSALKMIARFHGHYFNSVRKSNYEFIGRSYDMARFDLLDGVCKDNISSYLKLLDGWENDGYLKRGTVTKELKSFLTHYANELIYGRMKSAKPKELGGGFNTTIIHGDFRGGNLFVNPKNDDVIFYDFQNLHESTIGDELAWFFSSVDETVFRNNAKEILLTYYNEFILQKRVDSSDYTWPRFLAECSYGGSQYITYLLASAKDLIENIDDPKIKRNADELFSVREQRAIAYRKMFNTEKMILLCIQSCPNFPSEEDYIKLLPKELL